MLRAEIYDVIVYKRDNAGSYHFFISLVFIVVKLIILIVFLLFAAVFRHCFNGSRALAFREL